MGTKFDRISFDPEVMNGRSCIRNLRLTVQRVLETVALYQDWEELQVEYPELGREDIRQVLEFAAKSLDSQVFSLEAA